MPTLTTCLVQRDAAAASFLLTKKILPSPVTWSRDGISRFSTSRENIQPLPTIGSPLTCEYDESPMILTFSFFNTIEIFWELYPQTKDLELGRVENEGD